MTRRSSLALGVLSLAILAFAAAVFWLFYDNRRLTPDTFVLNLAALRTEAATLPGPGPTEIQAEIVSHTFVPKIAIVAGSTWRKFDMARASYRLVWSDRSIVIDTANDVRIAQQFQAASFDENAYRNVITAMDKADAIVVTHEHADHMGGLVTSSHLKIDLPKALLTPQQFNAGEWMAPLTWPTPLPARYTPLIYDRIHAIAPGVVVIKAPGHTPGSQMVYVRRADGREFIFMGDAASHKDNVGLKRIRSRYVTNFIGTTHDDRNAVMAQVRALHDLHVAHPDVVLIPGHDAVTIQRLEDKKLLVSGFHFSS